MCQDFLEALNMFESLAVICMPRVWASTANMDWRKEHHESEHWRKTSARPIRFPIHKPLSYSYPSQRFREIDTFAWPYWRPFMTRMASKGRPIAAEPDRHSIPSQGISLLVVAYTLPKRLAATSLFHRVDLMSRHAAFGKCCWPPHWWWAFAQD